MKSMMFITILAVFIAGSLFGGTITVTQPAGGNVEMGAACPIAWTATGVTSNVRINLIAPGGALIGPIIGNQLPGGSPYNWTVGPPAVVGESYRVRVIASDGSGVGESAVFTVIAGGGAPGSSGTISNVRLSGTSPHRIGDSRTISWAVTSVSQPLRLQLTRTGGDVVGVIADPLPAGTTTYNWPAGQFIGGTAAPGEDYKIRVAAADNSAASKSPEFALTNYLVFPGIVYATAVQARDLELRSIRYTADNGGHIAGLVFNPTEQRFDEDVTFSYLIRGARGGLAPTTHRVNLGGHQQAWINLHEMPTLSTAGLRVQVTLDGPNRIAESNENNNVQEDRLCQLDLSCIATNKVLAKRYMDIFYYFHIKFTIKVRNNIAQNVYNVPVRWRLIKVSDGAIIQEWNRTIERLDPSGEYSWNVDEKFGKIGREGSKRPRLAEGVAYRAVAEVIIPEDRLCDTNSRNNSATLSIEFPD